jgi:hypothetical protein
MCYLARLIIWISAVNPGSSENCSLCHRMSVSWLTAVLNSTEIFTQSSYHFLNIECLAFPLYATCHRRTAMFHPPVPGSRRSNIANCVHRRCSLLGLSNYVRHSLHLLKPAVFFTYHQIWNWKIVHADCIAFMCFIWISEQTVTFARFITNPLTPNDL